MNIDRIEKNKPPVAIEAAFTRSQVYHLLALGFKHPTLEWFQIYQSGYFIAEILKLFNSLNRLSGLAHEEANIGDKVYLDLYGIGYQDFEAKYLETFKAGFPEPACPLNSGLYVNGRPRSDVLLEISALYKHYGLLIARDGDEPEMEDHLSTELEFLHLLTYKEYKARQENEKMLLSGYLLAQKYFLERYLIGWVPMFYEKVHAADHLPFYPDLARISLRFTQCEYEFVNALTNFD